jgi:hypothetical protein
MDKEAVLHRFTAAAAAARSILRDWTAGWRLLLLVAAALAVASRASYRRKDTEA